MRYLHSVVKNVTLKLDEDLLNRARHLAVDENKSLSGWVSDLIAQTLKERTIYEEARTEALRVLEKGLHLGGQPLSRDGIYDRG